MLNIISAALKIGGFVFIFGTAGSSDLNRISFGQIVLRCVIGLCIIGIGYIIRRR